MPLSLHVSKLVLALLIACSGLFVPQCFAAAPGSRLLDCDGHEANPFTHTTAKLLAFVFVRTDCPVSNSYAPEIQRLYARFAPLGVAFWLVYPDADESPVAVRKHLKEFSYPCGALRDPGQTFAKQAKVDVTPEAALFRPDGELLYHGRIDNRFADFGKARPKATRHELADAIADALEGKPVQPAVGPAVGCFIEGAE